MPILSEQTVFKEVYLTDSLSSNQTKTINLFLKTNIKSNFSVRISANNGTVYNLYTFKIKHRSDDSSGEVSNYLFYPDDASPTQILNIATQTNLNGNYVSLSVTNNLNSIVSLDIYVN